MKILALLAGMALLVGVALHTRADTGGVFRLEVPELKLDVAENSGSTIPHSYISKLRVHVLRSRDEVSPGQINVRINGEAANIIMSAHTGQSDIVCDLDLYFRPGFLLHSGRNAIEAYAQSIYGRFYYATFFLDVRDQPESLREILVETKVSQQGDQPPIVQLVSPQGPVENVHQISLRGYIEGGVAPVTLTVQGQEVSLSTNALPGGTRGLRLEFGGAQLSFVSTARISSGQDSIEVIAADAHNNRTRLVIPIIQGTRIVNARYAVVIGVSRYHDPRIRNLQFAERDAEAIREFLLDPHGGGVPRLNLLYLSNENATYANIHSALFDFLVKPGPEDLVIVYFAGHGTPDPKRPDNVYMVGYDTDIDRIGGTAVPMWELQALFERTLRASVVTFVDACHSGGAKDQLANLSNQNWTKQGYGRHRAVITASDVNELSKEGANWGGGHGVFTYYLLQALRGAASGKPDRPVSVGEVFDYVKGKVVTETHGEQTPIALPGYSRGIILTRGASSVAAARFAPSFLRGEAQ
jgi:uncharacterized caspase-like protein